MIAGRRKPDFDREKLRTLAGAQAFRLEMEQNSNALHELEACGDDVTHKPDDSLELLMRTSTIPELRKVLKKQADAKKKSLNTAAADSHVLSSRPHTTVPTSRKSHHEIVSNSREVSRHLMQRDWMLTHGVANGKLKMPSTITTVVSSWVKAAESPQHRLSLEPSEIPKGAPKALVDVVSRPNRSSTYASRSDRASRASRREDENNDAKRWRELEEFLVRAPKPGEPKLPQSFEHSNGLVVPMSSLLMQMRRSTIMDAVMKGGERRHQWAHIATSEDKIKSQLYAFGARPSTTAGDFCKPSSASADSISPAPQPVGLAARDKAIGRDVLQNHHLEFAERRPSMTAELLERANVASRENSPPLSPRFSISLSPRRNEDGQVMRQSSPLKSVSTIVSGMINPYPEIDNIDEDQRAVAEHIALDRRSQSLEDKDEDWLSSIERERAEWKERERAKLEAQWNDVNIRDSLHIQPAESDVSARMARNQSMFLAVDLPSIQGNQIAKSFKSQRSSSSLSPNQPPRPPLASMLQPSSPSSSPPHHLDHPPPSTAPKAAKRVNGHSVMAARSSTAPTSSSRPHYSIPSEIKEPNDTIAILSSLTSSLDAPKATRRSTSPLASRSLPQFIVKGSRQAMFSNPYGNK